MKIWPLNVWIVEIGEPLPIEPNVRLHRYGQFSKWLASRGHDVTWWTSSFSHAPKKNFVYGDSELVRDGVRLKFIFGKGYRKNVSFARIRHQAQFAEHFLVQAASMPKPDVILAPVPTIEGASAAVEYARRNNIAVIADIRDLWPDEIRDLAPRFARGLAHMILLGAYAKLKRVMKGATAICGVSGSYLEYGLLHAGRAVKKDFVFPLGYTVQEISSEQKLAAEKWFDSLKLPQGAFVSCFFGTIGKFFDLSTVIAAARELGQDYYFILAGDGSALENFREEARDVKNIIFTGWIDAAKIQAVMGHSHAGLAPYKKDAKMSLPNKPFEYMSASLPVVSSIQFELKDILALNEAGLTYRADSVSDLVKALKSLREDESLRKRYGKNARSLFEKSYSSERVFENAFLHIEDVTNSFYAK